MYHKMIKHVFFKEGLESNKHKRVKLKNRTHRTGSVDIISSRVIYCILGFSDVPGQRTQS